MLRLRDILPSLQHVNNEISKLVEGRDDPKAFTLFDAISKNLTDDSILKMLNIIMNYLNPSSNESYYRNVKTKQRGNNTSVKANIKSKIHRTHNEIFAVREGQSGLLDVARQTYISLHDAIQLKYVEYCKKWGNIDDLKLNNTKARGYHLSIPTKYLPYLNNTECIEIVKKKTVVYFTTYELSSLNNRKQEVFHECYQFTGEALKDLIKELRVYINKINCIMESVALLDMLHAFAGAVANDTKIFSRPKFYNDDSSVSNEEEKLEDKGSATTSSSSCKNTNESNKKIDNPENYSTSNNIMLSIQNGRHPIVSRYREEQENVQFTPNATLAVEGVSDIQLIFGPNSSGKSTYLKQIATIVILAQSGCLVPAEKVEMKIFDRIHTRMSMEDDIEGNASTFLLECNEISRILSDTSENSLVLIDELGRATSTIDGMSLGWSVLEALRKQKCVCFFASHHHDLQHLKALYHNIVSKKMSSSFRMNDCDENDLDYTYGIDYAAKVGLPQCVIEVAKLFREQHSNSAFSYKINVVDNQRDKNNLVHDVKFQEFSSYVDTILKNTDEGNVFKASVVNKTEICEKLQALKLSYIGLHENNNLKKPKQY
jgi:DNA mismatch repair protein MSH4